MDKPKRGDHDKERHQKHEHEREHRREHEREGSGDDPRRHAAILERRWMGSPPPTAERYAHALKQWHALPGAVVQSAAELVDALKSSPHEEEHSGKRSGKKGRQP